MSKIINELEKKQAAYLEAIAKVEDSTDSTIKQEAKRIIESSMIHEEIALDEISG